MLLLCYYYVIIIIIYELHDTAPVSVPVPVIYLF